MFNIKKWDKCKNSFLLTILTFFLCISPLPVRANDDIENTDFGDQTTEVSQGGQHESQDDEISYENHEIEISSESYYGEEASSNEFSQDSNLEEDERYTEYDLSILEEDFEAESFQLMPESEDDTLFEENLEFSTLDNINFLVQSAMPQEDIEKTPLPLTVDGISVEKATIRWKSKSTGSDEEAKYNDLVLVPSDEKVPNQQWQLDLALSGKGFIETGDLEIVIPAYIWKDRNGNEPGRLTLATPEEPDYDSYGFTWRRVGDTYVITNARPISAGQSYMVQGTYRMTYPDPNSDKPFTSTYAHQMVDIDTTDENAEYKGISDWLYANILILTPHNQEELNVKTNSIRATIDTSVRVSEAYKEAKRNDVYVSSVPNIPSLLPENPEDYYYVRWYISGKAIGNQPYTLTLNDNLTDEYNGFILGFSGGTNQYLSDRNGSTEIYSGTSFNVSKSTSVWVAYPKSSFSNPNTSYTVTNSVTAEVKGLDDEIVTSESYTAQAVIKTPRPPIIYHVDKVWEYNADKYETDLGTIMSRRPNSVRVNFSGCNLSDTLSDANAWHTDLTDPGGYSSTCSAPTESFSGGHSSTSPRVYKPDGSYYYTVSYWDWQQRTRTYDPETNTYTFYNQYIEGVRNYSSSGFSNSFSKRANNHTNNTIRATSDKDLSLLRNNQETSEITYSVTRGLYIMPYTSNGSYDIPENLHQKTIRIELTDHTEYFNNRKLNEDEYYFTFATLPNPFVSNFQNSTTGYSSSVKIAAEMLGKTGSDWIKYAEVDTSGNISTFNGATNSGSKIYFPADSVVQTKLIARTNADRITANYDIGIKIKPTEQVVDQVENEFSKTDYIMMTSRNDASFVVYDDENNSNLNSVSASATTYLHGRNYRLAVDLDKSTSFTKNDKINRQLWFKNTITLNRVSSISTQSEFNFAVSENLLSDSDSGVFYDLLPIGMRVDESSIKPAENVSIQNINIIENYKDSGRQLLVINANLIDVASRITVSSSSSKYDDPSYPAYRNEEVWGWKPSTITFSMTYSYDEVKNRGLTGLRNHSAYVADENQFGDMKYWSGEKDIPDGTNHKETLSEIRNDVRSLMTDLSESNSPSTVYAGSNVYTTEVDLSALTSIVKQVSITGSDNWSFGTDNEVNVPEGGKYSYRITLTSGTDTTTKDIIILDSLEYYTPIKVTDPGDSNIPVGKIISQREFNETNEIIEFQDGNLIQGEPVESWKGYFRGIDVSEITSMGVDAKVYYSTTTNLDISNYNPDGETEVVPNILLDSDVWSLVPPTDLSEVTAIAIDCRKDTDGNDFGLEENESLIAYVHMKAPTYEQQPEAFGEDYKDYLQNDHAFNNVYMDVSKQDDLGLSTHSYDHFDFTQVGIYGMDIKVKKLWDDFNDNDKIRPDNLDIELVANGLDTGRTITLSSQDNWEGFFEHVIEFDDNGNRIIYSVKENVVDYTSSYVKESTGNLTTITVTNKHDLYTTSYPFFKVWESEEPEGWQTNIPSSIQVKLFADGVFTGKTKIISPNTNGEWAGVFTDLQKFKDGVEISYSVQEFSLSSDWITEYEDNQIKNTYYPYGDLIVKKQVINSTPESKDNLFNFVISLKDKNDNDLIGEFVYNILDENNESVSTGLIKNGDEFELKENWLIEIKDIPSGSRYELSEENKAGYILSSKTNFSNTIDAAIPQESVFTNTYNTAGSISISGNKTLSGRDITRNQFRFEIYDAEDKLIRTTGNTAEGFINFGSFTYGINDNGKEFVYTVKEIDRGRPGYTYDNSVYTVKVYPVDNGDGTMTVTQNIFKNDVEMQSIDFANEYHAEGEITLRTWKELEVRKLQNEEFEFELLDNDGNIIDTKKNSSDGSIIFDPVHFDETDIGKTYYYTIREKVGEDETVNYDENVYGYSVYVVDNGNGTLSFTQNAIDVSSRYIACPNSENHDVDFTYSLNYSRIDYSNGTTVSPRPLTITTTVFFEWISLPDDFYSSEYVIQFEKATYLGGRYGENKPSNFTWETVTIPLSDENVQDISEYFTYIATGWSANGTPYTTFRNLCILKGGEVIKEFSLVPNIYSENIETLTNNCETCENTGRIINEYWQPTEGELPVFKNTLKDGSLSISKLVENEENANPDQEFKFKIKLIGPGIENKQFEWNKEKLPYNAYLIYDANGGEFSDGETENKFTYLVNNNVSNLTNGEYEEPTREGYTFVGWFEDEEFNVEFTGEPEELSLLEDKRIYANWEINEAYAVYDSSNETVTLFRDSPGKYTNNQTEGTKTYYTGIETTEYTNTNRPPWYSSGSNRTIVLEDVISPISTYMWFARSLEIIGLDKLNTSNVTNVAQMFMSSQVTSLDLSSFDTSKVTDMSNMFSHSQTTSIIFPNNFGSSATNMSYMFWNSQATTLDLSSFNTSKVTKMQGMFQGSQATLLDLSSFDTSKVTDMSRMFYSSQVTSIVFSNNFGSSATNMEYMFSSSQATSLDLSSFNTSKVTKMQGMFKNSQATSLDLSSFDTSKVTNMDEMFRDSQAITLGLNSFDTSRVTTMEYMFSSSQATSLDLSSFNTSNVTYMSYMFAWSGSLSNIYVSNLWNVNNVTISSGMFIDCTNLPNYNSSNTDKTRARYNSGGYLTYKLAPTLSLNNSNNLLFKDNEHYKTYSDKILSCFDNFSLFTTIYAEDDEIVFVDGEAEITLKKNEKITFNNIPAGTAYQVWEETPDGWVLIEQRNTSGEIMPLETSEAEFKNRYQPGTTSVQFNGTKLLDNIAAEEGTFSFELYEGEELLETVSVLDGGFIQFSVLSYTEAGTHNYTIKEVNPNSDTIDFDTHVENITVVVRDNGDGTLSSEVTYDEDGIVFRNNTRPGTLEIKKNVDISTNANKDDVFTFEIEFTNENGVPLSGDENIYWYRKDAEGNLIQSRNILNRGLALVTGNELYGLEKNQSKIGETIDKVTPSETVVLQASNEILGGTRGGDGGEDYENSYETQADDIVPWTEYTDNGSSIKWKIDSDGNLYVEALDGHSGQLNFPQEITSSEHLSSCSPPWENYKTYIKTVVSSTKIFLSGYAIKVFSNANNLHDISGLENWDVKNVKAFGYNIAKYGHYPPQSGFFYGCTLLSDISPIKNWNVSGVVYYNKTLPNQFGDQYYFGFGGMFSNTSIYTFDLSNWELEDQSYDCSIIKNNGDKVYGCLLINMGRQLPIYLNIPVGLGFNFLGFDSLDWTTSQCLYQSHARVYAPNGYSLYYNDLNTTSRRFFNIVALSLANGLGGEYQLEPFVIKFDAGEGVLLKDGLFVSKGQNYYFSSDRKSVISSFTITSLSRDEVYRPLHYLSTWRRDDSCTTGTPTLWPGNSYKFTSGSTYNAYWVYDGNGQVNVNHFQEDIGVANYNKATTDIIRKSPGTTYSPELKSYAGFHAISSVETVVVDEENLVTIDYYYDRDRYTIHFDGNGNTSGQLEDISAVGTIQYSLPKNNYTKKGHIFTGWNTEPDGSGTTYLDQSQVLNFGAHGETVTLYAQWATNDSVTVPSNGKILVQCKAGETIVIPDLPYGTKYTIKEVNLPEGWSFESSTGEIGSIGANTVSSSQFNNKYSAEGLAFITAHKTIIGDTPQEGQFTFELYQGNTLLQSKTNGIVDTNEEIPGNNDENIPNPWVNTAPIEFDALQFTQEDIGKTFTYTIKEVNSGDNRINYDTHTETVRITVSDAGNGNLDCNVVYDSNGALFTNSLKSSSLQLKKNIVNPTQISEETEFNFTINLKDSAGNPISGEYPVRIKQKNYGIYDIEISGILYSHTSNIDDTGKQNGNYSNYLNTNKVISIPDAANLIVDVYYNGENIRYDWLSVWKGNFPSYKASSNATSTGYVTTNDGAPNNTNKFGGSQSGSYTVNGNILTNVGYARLTIPGDSVTFSFKSDSGGAGNGYGYYAIVTPYDSDGNPILTRTIQEELGFTETTISNGGTLTLKGGEELEITGLPDGATYEIIELDSPGWEITNKAGETGQIIAGETAFVEFENTYSTQGSFEPTANKVLIGGDLSEESFEFVITDENGNEISKAHTDENGLVTFTPIFYDQDDDGKTYAYYIKEVIDEERKDVIWDEHLSEIIVKVEDNGEGELIATPTVTNNDLEFTNTIFSSIEVSKEVSGNLGNKTEEFSFSIEFDSEITNDITFEKYEGETKVDEGIIELTDNTYNFTLKHNESIKLNQIPNNTKYTLSEENYHSKGYTTYLDGKMKRSVTSTLKEDTKHSFENSLLTAVPTEIRIRNLSSLAGIISLGIIVVLLLRKRKNSYN